MSSCFLCHTQLRRVEANVMGVRAQEKVASLPVEQRVAEQKCVCCFGKGGDGCHFTTLNKSPMKHTSASAHFSV